MPKKPRALVTIRSDPHYRRDAFHFGLLEAGFEVVERLHDPTPQDALVIWNRMGRGHILAEQFEREGAAVFVAENGYIGHDHAGRQLYALALNHHIGAGRWRSDESGRWRFQNIEVRPWRTNGEHVLLLPQRGIGEPSVAMPPDWPVREYERLKGLTDRKIRIRHHPGRHAPERTLEEDLENAWCAVVWASGAGIKALCLGIPVFSDYHRWIGKQASPCLRGVYPAADLENPLCSDVARTAMLNRLSWAQWSIAEIMSGEPFRRLLELHRGA